MHTPESPVEFVKPPRTSSFSGSGMGLTICISNKFAGEADAAGQGLHWERPCVMVSDEVTVPGFQATSQRITLPSL